MTHTVQWLRSNGVRGRTMCAKVFVGRDRIEIREVLRPMAGVDEAYEMFASRGDGVLKVASTP